MDHKRYIVVFCVCALGWALALAVAAYILDPLRFYHTPYIAADKYIANARYQNAGLIADDLGRRDCCDSVLIGTSLSQNFDMDAVSKKMGWDGTLNLTMAGSYPAEQKMVLEAALRTGKVKHVLWEMYDLYADPHLTPVNDPARLKKDKGNFFPAHLYDARAWKGMTYLFSLDALTASYGRLMHGKRLADIQAWYPQHEDEFGKGAALAAQFMPLSAKSPDYTRFDTLAPIDKVVAPIVRAHPDVTFDIFVPPYALHYYAYMTQEYYANMMGMRAYLLKTLGAEPNVRIHILDSGNRNIENMDLYKDLSHFHPRLHDEMLDRMLDSSTMVKPGRFDAYMGQMTRRVNDYTERLQP